MLSCVVVTFPYGVLGQLWYLIISISDLCLLSYFVMAICPYILTFLKLGHGVSLNPTNPFGLCIPRTPTPESFLNDRGVTTILCLRV